MKKPKYNFDQLLEEGYLEIDVAELTFQKAYSQYFSIRNALKRYQKHHDIDADVFIENDLIVVEVV